MTEEVIEFMKKSHGGQKRKFSPELYFNHPIRVSNIVKTVSNKEEVVIAALLHDLLEDTKVTEQELREKYGNKITDLVKELTIDEKEKKQLGLINYHFKIMGDSKKMSDDALIIRLADRLDNISDLKKIENESKEAENFAKSFRAATLRIINYVEVKRKLLDSHKKLIEEIRKNLK
jgi:guanosine-3',5'-bis(diphosphate) 3'-pyrophosphohydrolase